MSTITSHRIIYTADDEMPDCMECDRCDQPCEICCQSCGAEHGWALYQRSYYLNRNGANAN